MRSVVIAADNDPAGRRAASKHAERRKVAGIEVETLVSRSKDFNNDLRAISLEKLAQRLERALV